MLKIKQFTNGEFSIGRDNGQPLMNLALCLDTLVYSSTPVTIFPMLPILPDESEGNPYKMMQTVMSEISKYGPKNPSKKIELKSTINMGLCHISLYDRKYFLNYLLIKEDKFKNKYKNTIKHIVNNYDKRCTFLKKYKIKIPSKLIINYINNDELYDSDQEYILSHPQTQKRAQSLKNAKNKFIQLEDPIKSIQSLLSGNDEKANWLDNQHSKLKSRCHVLLEQMNVKRLTDYRIQWALQTSAHFILTVHLTGIYPKIYRKIRVPARLSLRIFHEKVLCAIFGYKRNFHSYLFVEPHRKNKKIGYGPWKMTSVDNMHEIPIKETCMDDRSAFLFDFFFYKGDQLRYIYDLGDQYHHTITLEKIVSLNEKLLKHTYRINQNQIIPTKIRWMYESQPLVQIIDGQRHGPLENMRGNKGYVRRLNVLQTGIDTTKTIDRHVIEKEDITFLEAVSDVKWSPNMDKNLFDSEKFDIKECQSKVKDLFSRCIIKNDLRHFVHPGRDLELIPNDKAYKTVLKVIRSKKMIGVRGCRTCHYGYCRKNKYRMLCCKGCKSAFYCNRKCQKKDWKMNHSVMCFDSNKF
eukprot:556208_1